MKAFYDIHTHFMNLQNVDFVRLAYEVSENVFDYLTSGMLSSSYLNIDKNKVLSQFLIHFQSFLVL